MQDTTDANRSAVLAQLRGVFGPDMSARAVNALLEKEMTNGTNIVLGNESCDMDSIVSSIVYATYISNIRREPYVPVLNIPREDLPLRSEVMWALTDAGIDVTKLHFAPEIDMAEVGKVVLVDHNEVAARQKVLEEKVVEIIDHHEDMNVRGGNVAKATIKVCGSASSLVAMAILVGDPADESAVAEPDRVPLHTAVCAVAPEIARLILVTVLLDTVNHSMAAMKSTPLDVFVTDRMAAFGFDAFAESPPEMRQLLLDEAFKKAERARFDVSRLTIAQTLRKDYKQWTWGKLTVGIAAITESFASFDKKGDVGAECEAFRTERGLDVLLIMSLYRGERGEVVKGLAIHPDHPAFIAEFTSGELQAALDLSETHGTSLTAFQQNNIAISRKTFTPKLGPFVASL